MESNAIIISNREYQALLYKYKNEHNELDLKVIDKEQLFNMLSFSYTKNPIPELIKENVSYLKARRYIDILRKCDDYSKNETLNKIYNLLKDEYITRDEYGHLMFQNKKIYVFEADEDQEIINILKKNNMDFEFIHFEDLGFTINESFSETVGKRVGPKVNLFDTKFQQYLFIYSEIRSHLLKDSTLQNKIAILCDEDEPFYHKNIGELFGIKTITTASVPLILSAGVKEKISNIYKEKKYSFTKEELENPNVAELKRQIEEYGLDRLEDFSYSYANLMEMVSALVFQDFRSNKGITVINNYNILPNVKIYVTNFQYDSFYKEYKDNDVLNDEELLAVGANPSYVKTLLDKRLKTNYLKYADIAMLSRVCKHLNDSIYNSQFISNKTIFNWKENNVSTALNEEGKYTSAAKSIAICEQFDKAYYRGKDEMNPEVLSYDHSYKPFDTSELFPYGAAYSITSLERYFACPFKYLYEKLIDSDSDYTSRIRGVIIHKVMEDVFDEEFDFKKSFERSIKEAEKEFADKGFDDKKVQAFILIWKHWLREFITIFRKNRSAMRIANMGDSVETNEVKVETFLELENAPYKFRGRIDRILFTENAKGEKYYTLIDYKTGKESFEINGPLAGKNIQLPVYYLGVEDNPALVDNARFGGLGIVHPYFNTIKTKLAPNGTMSEKTISDAMRFSGAVLDSEEYLRSIDSTMFKQSGGQKSSGGSFIRRGKADRLTIPIDRTLNNQFDHEYIAQSKSTIGYMFAKINNNEFPISPTVDPNEKKSADEKNKNENACKYCRFKNICYHDVKDFNSTLTKDLELHFLTDSAEAIIKKEEENFDA